MFKILDKKRINPQITFMRLRAPHIVENARPGQFVVIKIDEKGERIPLTIFDNNKDEETIGIMFQGLGKTTKQLASLDAGGAVADIIGPLGRPTHIEKFGDVICVGGGVGTAEIYPVAKALKEAGNRLTCIIGAQSGELLILAEELKAISDEVHITTDDGSAGRKGLVTEPLSELLSQKSRDLVYAVGPIMMMRAASMVTKKYNVKTIVSLNANMVDATGMCGTCRVTVGGKTKFTCVDGPDFDAHQVDFDEFINRDRRFKDKEEEALRCYEKAARRKKD